MLQKIITILYLSGEPVKADVIAKLIGATKDDIHTLTAELQVALSSIGLALLVSEDGLSIVTAPEQSSLVESFWKEELQGELTPATLQVLTLVAYLGSPTREEISYIRGVQSSQSIRTLTVRGLISRQGEVCKLTGDALKQLGVVSVEELPNYQSIHASLAEKLSARTA
jgi:segregation and condensation protein B